MARRRGRQSDRQGSGALDRSQRARRRLGGRGGQVAATRTGTGVYELVVPGKTGADGTLLLQMADLEPETSVPLASRAFLSYEFLEGKFIIQARKTTTDTQADRADASFYVAWVDFRVIEAVVIQPHCQPHCRWPLRRRPTLRRSIGLNSSFRAGESRLSRKL